jgi:hypothetical protein
LLPARYSARNPPAQGLSILSQLLREAWSVGRCIYRTLNFQFFPSCCSAAGLGVTPAVLPFNSFPVAALKVLIDMARAVAVYVDFQFFPSCCHTLCRGKGGARGDLPPDELSILSQLLLLEAMVEYGDFVNTFNSFPVAAGAFGSGKSTFAIKLLSILSQLLPRLWQPAPL